ncbi:MAG: hypothetical protein ACLSA6_09045 [Holdemania massiliensis]
MKPETEYHAHRDADETAYFCGAEFDRAKAAGFHSPTISFAPVKFLSIFCQFCRKTIFRTAGSPARFPNFLMTLKVLIGNKHHWPP